MIWSIVGIFLAGVCGGLAGWAVVTLVGWSGTGGAIAAGIVGMVVATLTWIVMTVLLRALGWLR